MSDLDTLPLADTPLLERQARRVALARAATSLALAAALAYCASVVLLHSGKSGVAPRSRPTMIVLDVSGSIEPRASRRVATLLKAAGSGRSAGLVLFSDSAYVALPPETRATELLRYATYFQSAGAPRSSVGTPGTLPAQIAGSGTVPWAGLTGGTEISTGLAAARQALRRARIGTADVVVASDFFDNSGDDPSLRRELGAYARLPGIALSIQPLPPESEAGIAQFRAYAGSRLTSYRPSIRYGGGPSSATAGVSVPLSAPFLVAACLIFVLLAADGVVGTCLAWRDRIR